MNDFDYVEKRLANTIGGAPARIINFSKYDILNDEGALLIAPAKINGVKKSTVNTDDAIIIGQDILVSMCTLAEVVNGEGYSTREKHIIDWCADYIHPYGFTNVYNRFTERWSFIQHHKNNKDTVVSVNTEDRDDPMGALIDEGMAKFDYDECLEATDEACLRAATFRVDDFVSDMNKVVNATRVYCALCAHYLDKNDSPAATFYASSTEYSENVPAFGFTETPEFGDRPFHELIGLFPILPFQLRYSEKYGIVRLQPIQDSVFDICWNTLADLVASAFGHQPYRPSTIMMKCPACGMYFIRKQSAQRYCCTDECNKRRQRKKSKKYYETHGKKER